MPTTFDNPLQTQEFKPAPATPNPRSSGISTEYGIDPDFFGGEDLKAARDQGFTDEEIKEFLDTHDKVLRAQNVPGGGGIYDQLKVN